MTMTTIMIFIFVMCCIDAIMMIILVILIIHLLDEPEYAAGDKMGHLDNKYFLNIISNSLPECHIVRTCRHEL